MAITLSKFRKEGIDASKGLKTTILEFLKRKEAAYFTTEISRELGISSSTIHYNLKRLAREGKVEKRILNGKTYYASKS